MEKKKPRSPPVVDDLAIVKAAAWAWYQRGSGSEDRPIAEYDFSRTHRPQLPSRYKLEAMKAIQKSIQGSYSNSPSPSSSPSYTDNSLLDHYEIDRISKELDYYMQAGSSERRSHRREVTVTKPEKKSKKINDERKKKKSGFWLMRGGVMCGSKDDVVEISGGLRRPEKTVRMMKVANCLPRVAHV